MRVSPLIRSRSGLARLALGWCLALGGGATGLSAPTGEYFIGDDPGIGQATPVPALDDTPGALTALTLPLPDGWGAGVTLGLRFRTADGQWGMTTWRQVFLLKTPGPVRLRQAWGEAFDDDPASLVGVSATGEARIVRPANAPDRLLLRAEGDAGGVGLAQGRTVFPLGGAASPKLYYALNRRPDPTVAAFVPLGEAERTRPTPVALDLGAPAPGFHSLHLRVMDAEGRSFDRLRFLHVMPATVRTLTGLNCVFRRVTGEGSSQVELVRVLPLTTTDAPQDVSTNLPAELAAGAYTLQVTLVTSGGEELLGETEGILTVSSPGGLVGFDTWAAARGLFGEAAGMMADPDQDGMVNLVEYAMGGFPDDREGAPLYLVETESEGAYPIIRIRYRQRLGGTGETGTDYTADGLRYTVEASRDLQTWRPYKELDLPAHVDVRPLPAEGVEDVWVELFPRSTLAEDDRLFVRLNLSVAR